MMKGKQNLKDGLFVVATLVIAYLTNLLVRRTLHTQSLAPMIFVLGVFLISLRTQGYFWGVTASLISVLAVNDGTRNTNTMP